MWEGGDCFGSVWDLLKVCMFVGKGQECGSVGLLKRRWVEFVHMCLMNSMYSVCVCGELSGDVAHLMATVVEICCSQLE